MYYIRMDSTNGAYFGIKTWKLYRIAWNAHWRDAGAFSATNISGDLKIREISIRDEKFRSDIGMYISVCQITVMSLKLC